MGIRRRLRLRYELLLRCELRLRSSQRRAEALRRRLLGWAAPRWREGRAWLSRVEAALRRAVPEVGPRIRRVWSRLRLAIPRLRLASRQLLVVIRRRMVGWVAFQWQEFQDLLSRAEAAFDAHVRASALSSVSEMSEGLRHWAQAVDPRLMGANGYRDYFKVLGVDRGADADTVKRAFRKLARQYHPDVNPGDAGAEAKFKEVSEAYEVLSDPEKRRRYEQFGQYWSQAGSASGMGGFDVDFGRYGNFDEFINDLLGRFGGPGASGAPGGFGFGSGFPGGFGGPGFGGPAGARTAAVNLDAEASITVSLADAFHGSERTLAVNDERVQVRIPPGVKNGSRLRLKGKGNLQPGTGRRGDLYLNLQLQDHPVWKLDGDQLRAELPLSLDELALGGEVSVATPDGEASVQVPPGMTLGRSLRLRGKGWPLKNGRGDLLLTPVLKLPEQLSDQERQLLEQLRTARSADPRAGWIQSARL